MDGVLMHRKGFERRSKKYAPVQNVSVGNWYMDAEDFHRKYKTGRVGVKKRRAQTAHKTFARGNKFTAITKIDKRG